MVCIMEQVATSARASMFSLWAEHDERAKLIINDQFAVLWANAAALELIEELATRPINQRCMAGGGTHRSDLLRWIVQSVHGEATWICLPHASGQHLFCAAIQLRSEAGEPLIGLTLRAAMPTQTIEDDRLQGLFHLTGAERRIVQALFSGCTAEEAGVALHISIGTVRVHIRHIYEKLQVGSREALFHKLLPYISA